MFTTICLSEPAVAPPVLMPSPLGDKTLLGAPNWLQINTVLVRCIWGPDSFSLERSPWYPPSFQSVVLQQHSFYDERFIHHVTSQQLNCLNEESTFLLLLNDKTRHIFIFAPECAHKIIRLKIQDQFHLSVNSC